MLETIHIILKDIAHLPAVTQITVFLSFLLPILFLKVERFRAAMQIVFFRIFKIKYSRNTKFGLYANALFRNKELHFSIVESFRFSGSAIKTDIYKILLKSIILETDQLFNFRIRKSDFNSLSIAELVEISKSDVRKSINRYSKQFREKLHLYIQGSKHYNYDEIKIDELASYILDMFVVTNKNNVQSLYNNIDFISGSSAFTNPTNAYHFILENIQQARHKGILHSFIFFEKMNGFIERTLQDLKIEHEN